MRDIALDLRCLSRNDEKACGPVDLPRVLDFAARLARHELRCRARLVKDYQAVPCVRADESRLGQLFLNLIVNAAQAIPVGHAAENEVRIVARHDDDGWVVVEVRDTGCGMAPELQERLFTPFVTTKPPGVGTGLGLGICQRIVASLGGAIVVESEPGRGSVFRVRLPAAPNEYAADAPPHRRGAVLVVDDEPLLCRYLRRLLAPDHDVTVATSAADAVERVARGERFDVILCDLCMPRMSGMELHAAVQELAPELARRMVFLTGAACAPTARAFLDAVPNARIEKPFEPATLRAVLRRRTAWSTEPNAARTAKVR
jgi:CheY-like chemotaxis protein